MQVIMLIYAVLLLMVSSTLGGHVKRHKSHKYSQNLTEDRVFMPQHGTVIDLYEVDGVVRNLLAPIGDYLRNLHSFSDPFEPTLYFNIHNEDGENQGLYVFKNSKITKINDGRDSVADFPRRDGIDDHIYIATADGIYTYDPHTEDVQKYGNLTDDVIAIDKVSGSDLIYILCADHKIYKVTNHGTEKELVAGVDYAKDFVLDFTGGIHYTGADNKPRFLKKDSTEPFQYEEFDFDVGELILGRQSFNPFVNEGGQNREDYSVLAVIDGVLGVLTNNATELFPDTRKVPDVTAFTGEFSFFCYYGAGGKIYLHNLILNPPHKSEETKRSSKKKVSENVIFNDRDVKADFEEIKNFN